MSGDAKRYDQGFTQLAAFFAVLLSMASLLAVAFKLNDNREQAATAANMTMSSGARGAVTGGGSAAAAAEDVKLVIKSDEEQGKKGSDGNWHDAYLPADLTVSAGATVRVTVYNYDDMPHTFTSMALGANVEIAAGSRGKPSKTTFTIHAPQKAGSYEWYCALPCDPWSMTDFGFMKGHVTVT